MEGKEGPKKVAIRSTLVGDRFNKQGNSQMRLMLGGHSNCRSPHPPSRLLVYIKALPGFRHVYHPDGLNNTLIPQDCVLETAPSVGMAGGMYIPRVWERVRSF